jgi:hypothetical protein
MKIGSWILGLYFYNFGKIEIHQPEIENSRNSYSNFREWVRCAGSLRGFAARVRCAGSLRGFAARVRCAGSLGCAE